MGFFVSINELSKIVKDIKSRGETIVVTNGCFDIIHAGHVRYLAQTKSLAGKLIVLLNSDKSVRGLKGEGRPINNENDRAEVLCAISSVDYVVIFDEASPARIIDIIKPNIYTKGGDYTIDTLPEKEVILKNNIRVEFIKFVEDKSTTNIINKINSK